MAGETRDRRHIWLVGMMASGKTTVGKLVAERLGRPFVDADAEIERAAGRSIAAIFAHDGEARFRALEVDAIAELAARESPHVIALGGGAVLDERNRRVIRETGDVIWLEASAEVLADRIAEGTDLRPLIAGLHRDARVQRLGHLLALRQPLYAEVASLAVANDGRERLDGVADRIARVGGALRTVRVDLGPRSYAIFVGTGLRAHLPRIMAARALPPAERCIAIVDAGVAAHAPAGPVITLPAGEPAKRFSELSRLLDAFAAAKLDRGSAVIAIGGGALTDVAGFAASVYLRGIAWVAVPTTLLGMVDAAIGGKTAVNLDAGKNLAGTFHQPRLVVCDVETLATLPAREVRSGLGEVLKYALIGPPELFALVDREVEALVAPGGLAARPEVTADLVARCAAVKAGVVSRDEHETRGERKVLNFGHTLGHAVEAASDFAIAHGDCVVLGMRAALHLSRVRGLIEAGEHERLLRFLARTGVPPLGPEIPDGALLAPMLRDKKFAAGRLLFVLLRGAGRPEVDVEVARDEIPGAIAAMRRLGP